MVREKGDSLLALESLPKEDRKLFSDFLDAMVASQVVNLLVRSNAPIEDLNQRGAYISIPVPLQVVQITGAIDEVMQSSHPEPMCIILQPAIDPGLPGHMSNERRVSNKRTRWLVEGLAPRESVRASNIIEATRASMTSALRASTERQVLDCLRSVAHHLNNQEPGYFHCEWVWDSRRLWIVQCDKALLSEGGDADKYLQTKGGSTPHFQVPQYLIHFTDAEAERWRKLTCPNVFHNLNLPVADVFVVTGDQWSSNDRTKIVTDINSMCDLCPVVVRCDISRSAKIDEIFLPTSPATRDSEKLIAFMDRVTTDFQAKGLKAEDWAFLLAFLVPARASAMVHAKPKAERVRIDSIWGFPDGLSFFPHDSSFYYSPDGRISEMLRYKGVCLMPHENGWGPEGIGAPFDWQSALNRSEVAIVAQWALKLADRLDSEVQLMVLARIGNKRGPESCLPWHYTTWQVPRYEESLRMLPPRSVLEVISSKEDITRLRNLQSSRSFRGYYIRPAAELLRDNAFLEDAARLAKDHSRPIYFEGSVLGHAYYVMARTGATVVPINEDEPREHGKHYDKLVRDKIPMVIHRAGGLARVRHVSQSEAQELLKQKLIEEGFEVLNATGKALIEELADTLEVIESLRNYSEIDADELARVRDEKRKKRGGFDHAVYLESTGLQSLRSRGEQEDRVPLFQFEHSVPHRRRSRGHSPVIEELPERKSSLFQMAISLVPPISGTEQPALIVAEALDATIEIWYSGSTVKVAISRRVTSESSNQLSLFPAILNDNKR